LTRAIGDPCQFAATPTARACLAAAGPEGRDRISGRPYQLHLAVANRLQSHDTKLDQSFCRLIPAQFGSHCSGQCESGLTPAEKKMVDELHRQRVLNFLEMFYAGDIEGALSRCTDDVEFFANAPIDILPHMGHHRGKDELRTMWQTVHARYSHMRYEVPILVAEGDKVAANIRVFFRKSSNDRVVQFDIAAFYTFRDGRISEIREIMDTFDLVQQVLERDVVADLAGHKFHEV
jgi:ketosteroid isomerase-like protein